MLLKEHEVCWAWFRVKFVALPMLGSVPSSNQCKLHAPLMSLTKPGTRAQGLPCNGTFFDTFLVATLSFLSCPSAKGFTWSTYPDLMLFLTSIIFHGHGSTFNLLRGSVFNCTTGEEEKFALAYKVHVFLFVGLPLFGPH